MSPWRERMIITLICGQLGGPGWSRQCVYSKTLGGFELVVHSIDYMTKNMTALNVTHNVKTTTFETSPN